MTETTEQYREHPNVYRPGDRASFNGRPIEILEVIPNGLRLFYRAMDLETEREYYLRPSQLRPARLEYHHE